METIYQMMPKMVTPSHCPLPYPVHPEVLSPPTPQTPHHLHQGRHQYLLVVYPHPHKLYLHHLPLSHCHHHSVSHLKHQDSRLCEGPCKSFERLQRISILAAFIQGIMNRLSMFVGRLVQFACLQFLFGKGVCNCLDFFQHIWDCMFGTWGSGPLLHMACMSPLRFNWFLFKMI